MLLDNGDVHSTDDDDDDDEEAIERSERSDRRKSEGRKKHVAEKRENMSNSGKTV